MNPAVEKPALGITHAHVFVAEARVPRIQSAHDTLGWDVSKSRVLAFSMCSICDAIDPASIDECGITGCVEHPICRKPYR